MNLITYRGTLEASDGDAFGEWCKLMLEKVRLGELSLGGEDMVRALETELSKSMNPIVTGGFQVYF